jgi:hypothetical protein
MTTFKEQMAADVSAVFLNADEFADETVVYNDGTGDVTVTGIVDYGPAEGETKKSAKGATIIVAASEVPDPGYRHTFTIAGVEWQVAMNGSVPDVTGDGQVWEIGLITNEKVTSWRR